MAAKIYANTGAGGTYFLWGPMYDQYTYGWYAGSSAGWKSKATGMNSISWKVTAPSISSAYGGCYYP